MSRPPNRDHARLPPALPDPLPARPAGWSRRGWLWGAGALGAGALGAAAATSCGGGGADHTGPNAPQAVDWPAGRLPPGPRRVAWVFGSGGPRGFVHVGVLKALAELGLAPDLVVGASVGALVATFYAGGLGAARIEQLALDLQPWQFLRWNLGGAERWRGDGLADLVNQALDHRPLQALPLPVACAVQRLRDGAVLGFNQGDAGLAVQAASSIEGQMAPLTLRGERYADADLRMPLPVRLARALGATRVLAVDASAREDSIPPDAGAYRAADLHKRALTAPDAASADLLLHPAIGYWAGWSRDYRARVIAAGYHSTLAAAERLQALHRA